MKTKIINLKKTILKDVDFITRTYPNTEDILYQINMILDNNMDDDKIDEWFISNKYTIDIINEILER